MDNFRFLVQQIRKSEFSKNSAVLLGGTFLAQLIPVGISPILTRIYSPAEFGVLALFVSIAKIISVFITGRYESAIVLPKEDKGGVNLLFVCLILTFVSFVLLTAFSLFFKSSLLALLNSEGMEQWLPWIPFTALLMAMIQVLNNWLLRNKKFKALSSGKVVQAISTGGVQVSSFSGALVVGNISGQVVLIISYLKSSFAGIWALRSEVSRAEMWLNMKRYKNFPLVTSLHRFFDLLQSNVLISLISSLFSTAILGFYSLTTRTLLAPAALIGSAVGNVFYQKATSYHQNGLPILPLAQKVVLALLGLGFIGFGILFFAADLIFETVFGPEWVVCALYTRILTPWLFLNFISAPVSGLVNVLGEQRTFFVISAFGNTIAVAVFAFVGWKYQDIQTSLFCFSGLMSAYTLVYLFSIFKALKKFDKTCV